MSKVILHISLITITLSVLSGCVTKDDSCLRKSYNGYYLSYQNPDINNIPEYIEFIDNGIKSVQEFLTDTFKNEFDIIIHPSRNSLDSAWQKDWKMPSFRSECWMIASGTNTKLDILSPKIWDDQACEHNYSAKKEVQQIITHELFHVYHGQSNISPDFTDTDGIDWFVEGFATYASGQLDTMRINEIQAAILNDSVPDALDKFWTGNMRYGLSGSMVMFIDNKIGRAKIKELLKFNKKTELLGTIGISETELLSQWKAFMQTIKPD